MKYHAHYVCVKDLLLIQILIRNLGNIGLYFSDDDTLECFDSDERSPDGYSVYLRQFMGRFYRIKVNKKRLQSNDTDVCGQYCLVYLMCRTRGYSMDQITDMFNENYHLNDQFVYYFIDERFHCCMSYSSCSFQICTCDNKI
jgi:hypothetical protein